MCAKPSEHRERVAILDAGAQYGKMIDRRVRELNVESDLMPINTPSEKLKEYKAIIISGGPQSVYGSEAPEYDPKLLELGVPILGICFGMHLINHVAGGRTEKHEVREDGQFEVQVKKPSSLLFDGLPNKLSVLLTHGDSAVGVAEGYEVSAVSDHDLISAIEHEEKKIYGVQFHPEVELTEEGTHMMKNFLFKIAKFSGNYTVEQREEEAIKIIKDTVKDQKVMVLLSGGVDSAVCAALLRRALSPKQISALHVDTGFMREGESEQVQRALIDVGIDVKVIEARERFAHARTMVEGKESDELCNVTAPEIKRKIIGDTFMRIADEEMRGLGVSATSAYLAQGTLRPDLIESASHLASSHAHVIKTHHNDSQLVRDMREKGRVIEPLADYHKDEVRQLGTALGLPASLVWRQPFPGPGLAIRVLCATEPHLSEQDDQLVEQLSKYSTSHIHLTLLPCRTVGVQGDSRSYAHLVALSSDEEANFHELRQLAKDLPKRVHGINRVIYVFGKAIKDRHVRSVTPTLLREPALAQLRHADAIVHQILSKAGLLRKLSQVPVILFPVNFGEEGKRSICIRPFISNDFVTGVPAMPGHHFPLEVLKEMVARIQSEVEGIARVCYDLTAKPPATTEWE